MSFVQGEVKRPHFCCFNNEKKGVLYRGVNFLNPMHYSYIYFNITLKKSFKYNVIIVSINNKDPLTCYRHTITITTTTITSEDLLSVAANTSQNNPSEFFFQNNLPEKILKIIHQKKILKIIHQKFVFKNNPLEKILKIIHQKIILKIIHQKKFSK